MSELNQKINGDPRVFVVIVNWNGKADTLECLASLKLDRYTEKKIIVVDNGSIDGSISEIEASYPDVVVLAAGKNLGFTGGNNLGIQYALNEECDYIYLLNNDTTVEADAIRCLIDAAVRQKSGGLFTPVIHYFDQPEVAWFSGSRINLLRGEAVHDNGSLLGRGDPMREIPWASGCAMLLPVDVIRAVHGFDDRFFLNWEDVDLSLRVRALGWKVLLVPSARILHKVGRSFAGSGGVSTYYYVRNQLLLLRLHGGESYREGYLWAMRTSLRRALRNIWRREANSLRGLRFVIRAIHHDFRGRFGAAHNL